MNNTSTTMMIEKRIPSYAAIAMAAMALASAFAVTPARAAERAAVAQEAACRNCGVVESVVAVRRQTQVKGIGGTKVTPGMAVGGVLGGVLGNQVGHGDGRAAATVVGAAGGAYAGHAIEKNRAEYTAYVMRIRMHDGSMRRIEQRVALARGSQVIVAGKTAQLARAGAARG